MSLTKTDLQAIQSIVDHAIDTKVPPIVEAIVDKAIDAKVPAIVQSIVDEAVEASDRRTAVAFETVFKQNSDLKADLLAVERRLTNEINTVNDHVGQVERIVSAEVERGDTHSLSIQKIRKSLRAA